MPESSCTVLLEQTTCSYDSKRLAFRRAFIEPLDEHAPFEIVTPAGNFRMTRAEFYAAFPEVARSISYKEVGEYQFPMIPYKAFQFLVRESRDIYS